MPYATKEKAKAYRAAHYQKNRERLLAEDKKRRQENPRREESAAYYQQNKERILKRQSTRYRENNAEIRVERAAYRAKNKAKLRRESLRWNYGMTPEQWEELFEKQGRRCRICRAEKNQDKRGCGFHTDHCHVTNKIRGILCNKCNLLLGAARDNIVVLKAAIRYLKGVAA